MVTKVEKVVYRAHATATGGRDGRAISSDGLWLAAGTENRQVILWDLKQGKETKRLAHEYPLVSLAFSSPAIRPPSM